MAKRCQRPPSWLQANTTHVRSGAKFQSEFLGAQTTPSHRLNAKAPSQPACRDRSKTRIVTIVKRATSAIMMGSTGRPGKGGLVQVEAIASRLSQPLIDSLLQ